MACYHHYKLTGDTQFLEDVKPQIDAITTFFLTDIGAFGFIPADYSVSSFNLPCQFDGLDYSKDMGRKLRPTHWKTITNKLLHVHTGHGIWWLMECFHYGVPSVPKPHQVEFCNFLSVIL